MIRILFIICVGILLQTSGDTSETIDVASLQPLLLSNEGLVFYPAAGEERVSLFPENPLSVAYWSTTVQQMIVLNSEGQIILYSTDSTSRVIKYIPDDADKSGEIEDLWGWSPDGRYLLMTLSVDTEYGDDPVIAAYNVRTERFIKMINLQYGELTPAAISWSPAGDRIVLDVGRMRLREITTDCIFDEAANCETRDLRFPQQQLENGEREHLYAPFWTEDADIIGFVCHGGICLGNLETLEIEQRIFIVDDYEISYQNLGIQPAWIDGEIFFGAEGNLQAYTVETDEKRAVTSLLPDDNDDDSPHFWIFLGAMTPEGFAVLEQIAAQQPR